MRSRLTYANVMATIAVFIALSGSATAALVVTGTMIKDASVTGKDIRDRSLTAKDFRSAPGAAAGTAGAAGARGPAGPSGPAGPTGPAGPSGPAGARGEAGAQGPKGDRGAPGQDGARGPAGPTASVGTPRSSGNVPRTLAASHSSTTLEDMTLDVPAGASNVIISAAATAGMETGEPTVDCQVMVDGNAAGNRSALVRGLQLTTFAFHRRLTGVTPGPHRIVLQCRTGGGAIGVYTDLTAIATA